MRYIHEYEVFIFDCDGVILDTNDMKLDAMRVALNQSHIIDNKIDECLSYFSSNFGRSRFHHIEVFLKNIIKIKQSRYGEKYDEILARYSEKCEKNYLASPICEGFVEFIETIKGHKYVASGSEQVELRTTLQKKELSRYFSEIYGSPERKENIVRKIVEVYKGKRIVLFGDAVADLEAALVNGIDFIACKNYSNTPILLEKYAKKYQFLEIETFRDLL
ncbi:HAD family hydrolase [Vibrio sp. 99-8-1]|uniref:HAD family hydrolase n=1 Tax=Vibrio sp. 99-8-1 TaxID=2607602 RepID=UPI00149334F4|nr:HAD family hydrolase [Vibrio sp. 99-8-1]NOI68721.1 HAD family hydrolase [Vibrio sp. 99-8-1]